MTVERNMSFIEIYSKSQLTIKNVQNILIKLGKIIKNYKIE